MRCNAAATQDKVQFPTSFVELPGQDCRETMSARPIWGTVILWPKITRGCNVITDTDSNTSVTRISRESPFKSRFSRSTGTSEPSTSSQWHCSTRCHRADIDILQSGQHFRHSPAQFLQGGCDTCQFSVDVKNLYSRKWTSKFQPLGVLDAILPYAWPRYGLDVELLHRRNERHRRGTHQTRARRKLPI
jgi:hypothetical protein